MRRRSLWWLVLALIVLAACDSESPAASATPTVAVFPPQPTFTPTATLAVTATVGPTRTSARLTLPPSWTPTATPTVTATPTITDTPTITPTPPPEAICEAVDFLFNVMATRTYSLSDNVFITVGSPREDAELVLRFLPRDGGAPQEVRFAGGQSVVAGVEIGVLVPGPGVYDWRFAVNLPEASGLCVQEGVLSVRATLNLLDLPATWIAPTPSP